MNETSCIQFVSTNLMIAKQLAKELQPNDEIFFSCPLCLSIIQKNRSFSSHINENHNFIVSKTWEELSIDVQYFQEHFQTCHVKLKAGRTDPLFDSCAYCRTFRAALFLNLCSKRHIKLVGYKIQLTCFVDQCSKVEQFKSARRYIRHLLYNCSLLNRKMEVNIVRRLENDTFLLVSLWVRHCLRTSHKISAIYNCQFCSWYSKRLLKQTCCPFCFLCISDVDLLAHLLANHRHNFSSDSPITKDELLAFDELADLKVKNASVPVRMAREQNLSISSIVKDYINHFQRKHGMGGNSGELSDVLRPSCSWCEMLKIQFIHSSLFDMTRLEYPCPKDPMCSQTFASFSRVLFHLLKEHTLVGRAKFYDSRPIETKFKLSKNMLSEISNSKIKRIIALAYMAHLQAYPETSNNYPLHDICDICYHYSNLIGLQSEQTCPFCTFLCKTPDMSRNHLYLHSKSYRGLQRSDAITIMARFIVHIQRSHLSYRPSKICHYCVSFQNGFFLKILAITLTINLMYSTVQFKCLFHRNGCKLVFQLPEEVLPHLIFYHRLELEQKATHSPGVDELLCALDYIKANYQIGFKERSPFLCDKLCIFCLNYISDDFLVHCQSEHPKMMKAQYLIASDNVSMIDLIDLAADNDVSLTFVV